MKTQPAVYYLGLLILSVFSTSRPQFSAPHQTSQPAQLQQGALIRVATELVVLDAQVLNKKTGAPVGGLGMEDFEVYEDGVRQQLAYFGIDRRPLATVLLFDYTATVLPVIKHLAERSEQALQHLQPEDAVAVMAFTEATHLLQDFTLDRATVAAAIKKAGDMRSRSSERAFLNEGVYQAAARLHQVSDSLRRRVIVILNDGLANVDFKHRNHTEKEALEELYEADTTVCGVTIKSHLTYFVEGTYVPFELMLGVKNPPGRTHSYAEKTGGEVVAGKKENAGELLAEVFDHLRTSYSFGYTPTNRATDHQFRRLKFRLTAQAEKRVGKVVIQARQGYYVHPGI